MGRWWQGATLYQLYVRSWQDSDGDGYGDLRGIIARLDHLSWLGVDGIWLSPTMPSPDADWGYDVSDYRSVHPDLGTMDDLDELIAAAGKRDMRVLLDLVPNHTSSAHPWFVDAVAGRDSALRDYYVWSDPAPDGGPPNNWLDFTGRPAWQWDNSSGQYYLHNFLAAQPDLNWWQPRVHTEFEDILRFWFDRGVAGFRIDVAHGLYKDKLLRDNPPAEVMSPLGGRFGQVAKYSMNQPEVHEVYRRWRELSDGYETPRLLLGETWVGELTDMAAYYGDDDELQLAFNFPFVFAPFAASELAAVVERTMAALPEGACPVWTASNHDVGRFPSRWCGSDDVKVKLALLVLATLPGTLVLYYGDEIGMTDVAVPPELARDVLDGQLHLGRDRGRTPMQWDDSPQAGFTAADTRSWLPPGDTAARNVAAQRSDPGSVLSFCRELLSLRRSERTAAAGEVARYQRRSAPEGIWRYASGRLEVSANFTAEPAGGAWPDGEVLLSTHLLGAGAGCWSEGTRPPLARAEVLAPWEGVIARRLG